MTMLLINLQIAANESNTRYKHLRMLSEDSLLRNRCEKCNRAWLFKDKTEKACDSLEESLVDVLENGGNTGTSGVDPLSVGWNLLRGLAAQEKVKQPIRDILPDSSDETKRDEYNKISDVAYQLRKQYEERKEVERQKAEDLRKNPPYKF